MLYNKSQSFSEFSEIMGYIRANYRAPHRVGTIAGALEGFFEQLDQLTAPEPDGQSRQRVLLLMFRAYLRRAIRQNWRKATTAFPSIVNNVGCRADIMAPLFKDGIFYQELAKDRCGELKNCGVIAYFSEKRASIERIRDQLKQEKVSDPETARRIKSLRTLARFSGSFFQRTDCYSCGDAIVAMESPEGSVVITKNKKHFEPICGAIGRRAVYH